MKFTDSRKASISLSINAIVVIVIAFVVLGLALTLTRAIFKGAMGKIPEALDLTQLEAQPSAENPITIPDTVTIKSGGTLTLSVGYYNKWPNTADAKLGIVNCLKGADTPKRLTVLSPVQSVKGSDAKGYKIILEAKDQLTTDALIAGTYICRVIAYENTLTLETVSESILNSPPCEPKSSGCEGIYEDKQIFLQVTS